MKRRETMGNVAWSSPRYRYSKRRYRLLFGAIDRLCSPLFRCFRAIRKQRWSDPRSILIVQLDHIGDAVLTTSMLGSLKERFPNAVLDVVASQSNHEVFRANPRVHRVHVSRRNWHARQPRQQSWLPEVLRLVRTVRRYRYDVGIDARGDFLVALVLWLASIPRRVGWTCGGGDFLLTDAALWHAGRHELEARRALLATLQVWPLPALFRPEVSPNWADLYHVRELLQAEPGLRTPIVVIHVGAGTPAKRWPAPHWSLLADRLLDHLGGSIILIGEPNDQAAARRIARCCPHVFDWTGRLTLMQVAALFREADLFVGCDSGPAHLAAAARVPSVVLFSGTNNSECWRPVGPFVRVLRHPVPCAPCHQRCCPIAGHPCMSGISVPQVLQAARDMIDDSRALREEVAISAPNQVHRSPTRKRGD